MLNVSAPFHCDLMLPAQERLAEVLETVSFGQLSSPIVENVSAKQNSDPTRVRTALTEQVSSPVRWQATIEGLIEEGVDTFVEVGPGKVLTGLARRIERSLQAFAIFDADSLDTALDSTQFSHED